MTQTDYATPLLSKILPGHPIHIFLQENRAIEELLSQFEDILQQANQDQSQLLMIELRAKLNLLQDIKKHYQRQEELLYPLLQQFSMDDVIDQNKQNFAEIQNMIQKVDEILSYELVHPKTIVTAFSPLTQAIPIVIKKEESVIFPIALEKLTEDDWIRISSFSNSYGYCIIVPNQEWQNSHSKLENSQAIASQMINFSTGRIKSFIFEEIMKNLPIQLSFIDEKDNFIYFSPCKNPVFRRTLASLGRNVRHCHPPKSIVHVTKILTNLKEKKRELEEF